MWKSIGVTGPGRRDSKWCPLSIFNWFWLKGWKQGGLSNLKRKWKLTYLYWFSAGTPDSNLYNILSQTILVHGSKVANSSGCSPFPAFSILVIGQPQNEAFFMQFTVLGSGSQLPIIFKTVCFHGKHRLNYGYLSNLILQATQNDDVLMGLSVYLASVLWKRISMRRL